MAGPLDREQDRRRFRRWLVQEPVDEEAPASGGALHESAGCPHRDSPQSVLAAMADEHAQIDPLPAAGDTAFASPAHDWLADVSDASASHLAHEETDALA